MSIPPNDQYDKIKTGLESGNRVVFNTKTNKFESIEKSKAKKLSNNPQYVTKLSEIKSKVEAFIKENDISTSQRKELVSALTKRTESLSTRVVLFGGSIRDKAVGELKDFNRVVQNTQKQQSLIPQEKSIASSEGPLQGGTTQKAESPPSPSAPQTKTEGRDKGKERVGSPEQPQGAPPPLAMTQKAKGPSTVQQMVTKKRKRIVDEQEQPKLPPSVDAGDNRTLKALGQDEKRELETAIDHYLNGNVVQTATAAGKKIGTSRAKDGLKAMIQMIEGRLKAHSNALKALAGPTKELERLESELEAKQARLADMVKCQESSQSYYLYTTKINEDTKETEQGTPIRFYTDREIQEQKEEFQKISAEDQVAVKSQLATEKGHTRKTEDPLPEQRTLKKLIETQRKILGDLEKQIEEKKTQVAGIKVEIVKIEQESNGEVSFPEYAAYVADRKALAGKYETMVRWMGEVQKTLSTEELKKEKTANIIQKIPYLSEEQAMYVALGTQKKVVADTDLTNLLNTDSFKSEVEIKQANAKPVAATSVAEQGEPESSGIIGPPPPPPPPPGFIT